MGIVVTNRWLRIHNLQALFSDLSPLPRLRLRNTPSPRLWRHNGLDSSASMSAITPARSLTLIVSSRTPRILRNCFVLWWNSTVQSLRRLPHRRQGLIYLQRKQRTAQPMVET
eukprot:PhF_6_TR12609/c0_g1_i1/m.19908